MASLSIPFIPFLSCFHPQLSIQEKRREKRWRKRKTREGNGANSQGHTPYLYLTLAPFCPFPISFHFSSLPISISHLHKILDWWVNGKREERNGPSLSFLSTIIFLSFGRVWWTRKRWKEMNRFYLSYLRPDPKPFVSSLGLGMRVCVRCLLYLPSTSPTLPSLRSLFYSLLGLMVAFPEIPLLATIGKRPNMSDQRERRERLGMERVGEP